MLREILGLEEKEFAKITGWLFAYYFKRINQKQFIDLMGDIQESRERALAIKAASKKSGYLLKNCKLYAYACHCAKLNNEVMPKAKDYKVTIRDANFLRRLNLNHIDVNKYRVFTLHEFDLSVKQITTERDMRNHVGRLVSKKFKFIMKSYGVEREDLYSELFESAVNSLYRAYPFYENYLHFTNVAKANIHNAAMSLILYHTTKSRQQLQTTSDTSIAAGFESVNVDISNLNMLAAPEVYGSNIIESLEALAKLEHRMKPRLKDFILILAGHHHVGFSAFVNAPNDVLIDSISYEKYMKKAMDYFEVTPAIVNKVFIRMKKAMIQNNIANYRPKEIVSRSSISYH